MTFFAISAQVIPVMYLAMAFEARMFRKSVPDGNFPLHRWVYLLRYLVSTTVVMMMAAGEASALVVLYREATAPILDVMVWFGLLAGLVGVVAPILWNQFIMFLLNARGFVFDSVSLSLMFLLFVPLLLLVLTMRLVVTIDALPLE